MDSGGAAGGGRRQSRHGSPRHGSSGNITGVNRTENTDVDMKVFGALSPISPRTKSASVEMTDVREKSRKKNRRPRIVLFDSSSLRKNSLHSSHSFQKGGSWKPRGKCQSISERGERGEYSVHKQGPNAELMRTPSKIGSGLHHEESVGPRTTLRMSQPGLMRMSETLSTLRPVPRINDEKESDTTTRKSIQDNETDEKEMKGSRHMQTGDLEQRDSHSRQEDGHISAGDRTDGEGVHSSGEMTRLASSLMYAADGINVSQKQLASYVISSGEQSHRQKNQERE
mmetsp:Transcript_7752/g.18973  ORF Transcript_7752/g.18973 Transcript_7752/m.18973 type:complete len:284 (+) Transcript_7752:3542-4393(+)